MKAPIGRSALPALAMLALLLPLDAAKAQDNSMGLLPDFQTVVIKHMQIQNEHGREMLRLTNGIANSGMGHLQLRPDCTPGTFGTDACPDEGEGEYVTNAYQEILDGAGNIVMEKLVSSFEFHPTHNHWHLQEVARFEVYHANDDGTGGDFGRLLVNDLDQQAVAVKVGFCLIDSYRLADGKGRTSERLYWDCEVDMQGIQSGWVDQYHQALDDNEVDITGAEEGTYYLVSTSNPENFYVESDNSNNMTWVSFELSRHSNGNPKIHLIDHAPCEGPGLCGEFRRNG